LQRRTGCKGGRSSFHYQQPASPFHPSDRIGEGDDSSMKALKTIVATGTAICGIAIMFVACLQDSQSTLWFLAGAIVLGLSLNALDPHWTDC
jgi:hypothetical protein